MLPLGRQTPYGYRAMLRPGLREALLRRWDTIPEDVRRAFWDVLTFQDHWDVTFRRGDPDCESRFADLITTPFRDLDIEYRRPRIKHPYEIDPVMALQHVLEDRSHVPDLLDILIYPSAKVCSILFLKVCASVE